MGAQPPTPPTPRAAIPQPLVRPDVWPHRGARVTADEIVEQFQRFAEDVMPVFAGRSEIAGAAV